MAITNHPNMARINTLTNEFVLATVNAQADFYSTNGYYFQGTNLLDILPDGTEDVSADTTKRPSDKTETWYDFAPLVFKNNLKIPVNARIDVIDHEGDIGWGWTLTLEVMFNGDHWVYKHYHGPQPEVNATYDEWYIQFEGEI